MTDRYDPANDSWQLCDAMHALFDGPKTVTELMKELKQPMSTISSKVLALKRDGFASKVEGKYVLDKDKIYSDFVDVLVREIGEVHTVRTPKRPKYTKVKFIGDGVMFSEDYPEKGVLYLHESEKEAYDKDPEGLIEKRADEEFERSKSFANVISKANQTISLFHKHKDTIFSDPGIRKHLMEYVEFELEWHRHNKEAPEENQYARPLSLSNIFEKYWSDQTVRDHIVYLLVYNSISVIPAKHRQFWKYLCILQALLPMAAITEDIHAVSIASQVLPGKENRLKDLGPLWGKLQDKSAKYLEELK